VTEGTLIRHEDEITSREALVMESEFIHWIRSDWDRHARMGDERAIGRRWSPDHSEAF
jgi:hypothetical protein